MFSFISPRRLGRHCAATPSGGWGGTRGKRRWNAGPSRAGSASRATSAAARAAAASRGDGGGTLEAAAMAAAAGGVRCGRSSCREGGKGVGGDTWGSGPVLPGHARRAASAAPRYRCRHHDCSRAAAAPPPPAAMGGHAGSGGGEQAYLALRLGQAVKRQARRGGGGGGGRRGAAQHGDMRHWWVWRRGDIGCAGGAGGCRARWAQGLCMRRQACNMGDPGATGWAARAPAVRRALARALALQVVVLAARAG